MAENTNNRDGPSTGIDQSKEKKNSRSSFMVTSIEQIQAPHEPMLSHRNDAYSYKNMEPTGRFFNEQTQVTAPLTERSESKASH